MANTKKMSLVLCVVAMMSTTTAMTVFPKPQSQQDNQMSYMIDRESFQFNTKNGNSLGVNVTDLLNDAYRRYLAICLGNFKGSQRADDGMTQFAAAADGIISSVDVSVKMDSDDLSLETNESYVLNVKAPTITLDAITAYGAIRGLETLSQLIYQGVQINGTVISDSPRYQYRGTMIDTSRHFYPVTVIKQHLDAMAYSKFNVLHWHIVDSVSFPYESSLYPQMSKTGAYSPSHVYSRDDIKDIVEYAKYRGIRVIPEFDTPGHVRTGYDSLNPPILTDCYSNGKPDGTTGPLNPILNATYDFLKSFWAEVKDVFPDKFVHVGGDEVSPSCWQSNPAIQEFVKTHPKLKSFSDLEQYYELQLLEILKAQGSSYICWQEIFDNGVDILPDTVVEVWKGGYQKDLAAVTAAGYHAVLSAPFYLNYISYGEDWPKYYSVEPSNFTGGAKADAQGLVAGVEVCMWSEFVDATNFIPRTWPRACAVAERGWSNKDVTDIDDARTRLHELRCKMIARGIPAEPIANGGSPTELNNHHYCDIEWTPKYIAPGN